MTGQLTRTETGTGYFQFEDPWPEEIRCDWCYNELYKNRAELRVEISRGVYNKLCLSCWLTLAFVHLRMKEEVT